jgi:hypothetical protein
MTRLPRLFPPGPVVPLAFVLTTLGLSPASVRAELPPWVYGEQQRQAPLVVKLRVLEARREGNEAHVRGKVLGVWRQPAAARLKAGQTIGLRYSLPPKRAAGWAGPSSLPLPRQGEELKAWLQPISGSPGTFAPAAGGRSFGPSLESMHEPQGRSGKGAAAWASGMGSSPVSLLTSASLIHLLPTCLI